MTKKTAMNRDNGAFWQVLLAAANRNGYTMTAICEKLGLSRAYISKGKTTGTVPLVDTAARLLGACGYALAAVPADNVPDDALVITAGDDCER